MIIIYSNVTHKTGPCPQAPVNWWLSKQRKAAPPCQDILAGGTFMSFELTNNIWFYGWKYVNHPSWDTAYLLEVANNPKEFEVEYEELINDILKFINLDELH